MKIHETGCYRHLSQHVGRVIACSRDQYTLKVLSDEYGTVPVTVTATLSGTFKGKRNEVVPVVGDHVDIRLAVKEGDNGGDKAVITACRPRTSHLSRKPAISGGRRLKNGVITGGATVPQVLAANVDIVFIVSGLVGDFNLHRIERYLMVARSGGVHPVILLNKADLCHDIEEKMREVKGIAGAIPVHVTDACSGYGMDALLAYMTPGVTMAFLGSSGVGKSTIINWLFGEALQVTGATNSNTGKGRHTTTRAGLFEHPMGACLIDTPGIRELRPWCDETTVDESFADITELSGSCRYSDCSHKNEPGCSLREALESGELSRDRYDQYRKLMGETKELGMRRAQRDRHLMNMKKARGIRL